MRRQTETRSLSFNHTTALERTRPSQDSEKKVNVKTFSHQLMGQMSIEFQMESSRGHKVRKKEAVSPEQELFILFISFILNVNLYVTR